MPGSPGFVHLFLSVMGYLVRRVDFGSILLSLLAVQSIAARTAPRADLFTTVFFAICLGELWDYHRGKSARLWVLPVLMLLWVNFHPGFVAGLAAICAYLLAEAADFPFMERRTAAIQRLRHAWAWIVGSAAVTFVNPWARNFMRCRSLWQVSGSLRRGN